MTIAANTDWEIRTTGVATNGGGFKDLDPGTSVDYSQQAAAQLALSDISIVTKDLTSSTGGFTAAMVGNVIFLLGSGVTTGWYQIVGYTDTNNIDVDRNPGNGSGVTGNVGGAYKFDPTYNNTFFSSTNKSGYNVCHIAAGTYTGFGTSANTIASTYLKFNGYNSSRGDDPIGANRPLLDTGDNISYINWSGHYGRMENVRIDSTYSTNTTATFYSAGVHLILRNCKITRSGYANAYAARIAGDWTRILQSEFESTSGLALQCQGAEGLYAVYCYFHDSDIGITYSGSGAIGMLIDNCIIDTCTTTGVQTLLGGTVINTTIYDCGTGVLMSSSYGTVVNNIIHTCTTGINSAEYAYDDNNCIYNCGTPRTGGIVAGPNSIASDPLLVDPANQDFTLDVTSPAFNTAIKLGAAVGLP